MLTFSRSPNKHLLSSCPVPETEARNCARPLILFNTQKQSQDNYYHYYHFRMKVVGLGRVTSPSSLSSECVLLTT